ncbi:MAG: exodeoxyribonuclease III [Anaerococcus sp.]|nr:exodeoxyribonuclease III [Anaerococcus sp.]
MKFISWNIDSLNAALTSDSNRAIMSRAVLEKIKNEDPDLIALQETKLPATGPSKKHLEKLKEFFPTYDFVWNSSKEGARKSYAGTMTLYKKDLSVKESFPQIGAPDTMDLEGRIITLELDDFYFSQVYTPNAGSKLNRLALREKWDKVYADYLAYLDKDKPVIACGDYNVAHEEIDLAHPDNNHMSAGFTDEERRGFGELLAKGFTDTFRFLNKDLTGAYTWWAQRVKTSKINNSGWRIDYFLVSDRIQSKVIDSTIIDSGQRQDHTPIMLTIDI